MKQLVLFIAFLIFTGCLSKSKNNIVKIDPKAIALNNSAVKLMMWPQKDKLDSALVLLNKAIKIEPEYVIGYSNKIGVYIRQGNLNMALETARQLEKIQPENPQGIIGLGLLLERTGSIKEAQEKYQKALLIYEDELNHTDKNDKKYMFIQTNYAADLIFLGREEDAKKELYEILKKDSSYYPAKMLFTTSKKKLLAEMTKANPVHHNLTYTVVQPKFPGGGKAFITFLQSHIHYPPAAKKKHIQGPVILSFVVEKDGSLTNVRSLRNPGIGLAEEAIRVLSLSPKWSPGIQNNHPVRTTYTIPVIFSLGDNEN